MVMLILLITIIPVAMFFGSPGKFMFVNLDFFLFLQSLELGTACNCNIKGTLFAHFDQKFIFPIKFGTSEQIFIFWISKMSQILGSPTVNKQQYGKSKIAFKYGGTLHRLQK